MTKSQYYKITYDHDFDENELTNKLKILAMKNNRQPIPPRIYVYKNDTETIALLNYEKKVTLSNYQKFNFDNIIGKLEPISSSVFENIIRTSKIDVKYKLESVICSICNKEKLKNKFISIDTPVCMNCHKENNSENLSMEIVEELDPSYRFRDAYDIYTKYTIFSKKHGLTKDAYINKLENDLAELNHKFTECLLTVHKMLSTNS